MAHDPVDDARPLLKLAALLEDSIRDLVAITEETARLRAENAQLQKELAEFRAVVDELRGWAGVPGRPERALLQ